MKHSSGLRILLLVATFALIACDASPETSEKKAAKTETPAEELQATPNPGDAIIAKLDQIIIPIVDFEDTSVEECIDYLRVRSIELDPDREPERKGISFVVRRSRPTEEPERIRENNQANDVPRITFQAIDIKLSDALVEICKQAALDTFITSHGIIYCEKGVEPMATLEGKEFEIWHKLTP